MPMLRHSRSRLPLPLRVLVLVLFAFGLVMQPVIASLGEMHELAHDPTGGHALAHSHTDHSDGKQVEPGDTTESGQEPASTLHFLMHHAHCCGLSGLAVLPAMRVAPMALGGACPALVEPQRLLQAPSLTPFRPPILA